MPITPPDIDDEFELRPAWQQWLGIVVLWIICGIAYAVSQP